MPLTPREKLRQRGVKARARAAAIAADPDGFRATQAEKMRQWREGKRLEKERRRAARAAMAEDRPDEIPTNLEDL